MKEVKAREDAERVVYSRQASLSPNSGAASGIASPRESIASPREITLFETESQLTETEGEEEGAEEGALTAPELNSTPESNSNHSPAKEKKSSPPRKRERESGLPGAGAASRARITVPWGVDEQLVLHNVFEMVREAEKTGNQWVAPEETDEMRVRKAEMVVLREQTRAATVIQRIRRGFIIRCVLFALNCLPSTVCP